MGLLLVLFWCWAVARMRVRTFSGIIHGSGSLIPGWVGANSRLSLLREFARKGVIYLTIFPAKRPLSEESRRNSRLGGKSREIPVRHDLEQMISEYIDAAGLRDAGNDTPLFRTALRRTRRLTEIGMNVVDICRLMKRSGFVFSVSADLAGS